MKFWAPALLATGIAASAVLDPPLVPADNDINLFADNYRYTVEGHHRDREQSGVGASAAAGPAPRRIPSSYESAVLARRILALTPFGTISTVFPHDAVPGKNTLPPVYHAWENRPTGLGGIPVALPEYLANCEEDDPAHAGNPTLLAITIATTFRNARAGSNVSLALQWEPPHPPASPARVSVVEGLQKLLGLSTEKEEEAEKEAKEAEEEARTARFPPSVAALPRFSLLGYLEPITGQDAPDSALASCFVRAHPDAKYWLPGNRVHHSEWQRLVVTQVYWIGGFGDRAYIGWIPIDEWRNVTRAEWEKVLLPGEKQGWKEAYVGYEL